MIILFSYMGFTLTDGVAFLLILELLERWSADAERVLCSTHQPVQQTHTWHLLDGDATKFVGERVDVGRLHGD